MSDELNASTDQQPESGVAPEQVNEGTVYTEGTTAADKERLDAEYANTQAVAGSGIESTSTPEAEGRNEAGAAVPKGSVDDTTASDEDRLKAAYASFRQGMTTLGQHNASNIPGSLFYSAFQDFKAAAVGFDAVLGEKKEE